MWKGDKKGEEEIAGKDFKNNGKDGSLCMCQNVIECGFDKTVREFLYAACIPLNEGAGGVVLCCTIASLFVKKNKLSEIRVNL